MITPEELAAHEAEIAALLAVVDKLRAQAVIDAHDIQGLHSALDTARQIGAAMGIIMATRIVTEDEAFEVLRVASQTSNRKLRDIADDVVRTGALPD